MGMHDYYIAAVFVNTLEVFHKLLVNTIIYIEEKPLLLDVSIYGIIEKNDCIGNQLTVLIKWFSKSSQTLPYY